MRMWWLSMVSKAFCIMDVLMWNCFYGFMKPIAVFTMFLKISAYALCSNGHNFFIVYQIWTYE
jgi:hypothetical protein